MMTKICSAEWTPCIVETNLNLRRNDVPTLDAKVAEEQLRFHPDVIADVEDRENCDRKGYDDALRGGGYQRISAMDRDKRGVSCWFKSSLRAEKVFEMEDPHFMHARVTFQGRQYIDLMILRILVGRSEEEELDFKKRAKAWCQVEDYIDTLKDRAHIVLTGDFNHGVPCEDPAYYAGKPRQYYNYQKVCESLRQLALTIAQIPGCSKEGNKGLDDYSVDHLVMGKAVEVMEIEYQDPFEGPQRERRQGIPDHAMIVARLNVR